MTPNLNLYGMLSDLGRGLGGIAEDQRKRQLRAAIGGPLQQGDYSGAAQAAFQSGDLDTGVSLLRLAETKKLHEAQAAADAQAMGGLTGSVTPMSLQGGDMAKYRDAIASIESRGSGDYAAVGPQTKTGDRAYGRYQVMGANIPAWTKEILGRSMTPQEFLSDQKAQDAVFDAKFGGYLKSGGPQNAASMWFTGKPLAQGGGLADVNGMTGNRYADRFMQALGPQRVQVADASGRIPASVGVSGGVTAGPETGALEARRADLENRLLTPNISDNVRARLQSAISAIDRQLSRADRQEELSLRRDERRQVFEQHQADLQAKREATAVAKAPTADQSNAAGFSDRMKNAEKVLSDPALMAAVVGNEGVKNASMGKIPLVGAKWQTPEYKRYERAKKDFITAVLRKESGASISPTEFANEEAKYFPQPWDDEQTIKDKADARSIAIQSMERTAGPALKAAPSSGKPIPSNVLQEAQAAIPRKGREAVIGELQRLGFDTSGL